jgi:hypothetical protein
LQYRANNRLGTFDQQCLTIFSKKRKVSDVADLMTTMSISKSAESFPFDKHVPNPHIKYGNGRLMLSITYDKTDIDTEDSKVTSFPFYENPTYGLQYTQRIPLKRETIICKTKKTYKEKANTHTIIGCNLTGVFSKLGLIIYNNPLQVELLQSYQWDSVILESIYLIQGENQRELEVGNKVNLSVGAKIKIPRAGTDSTIIIELIQEEKI